MHHFESHPIAVGAEGNVLLAGEATDEVTFGRTRVKSGGGNDLSGAKLKAT